MRKVAVWEGYLCATLDAVIGITVRPKTPHLPWMWAGMTPVAPDPAA
jgi:hypothetical protein